MRKFILTSVVLFAANVSHAGLKLEKKVEPVFIVVETGKQVDPIEAAQAAMAGQNVLKCDHVELVGKATGNISFKKKK